jgi:lysophospholipase L1-like esterase
MKRVLIYGDSNTFGTGPMAALKDDTTLPRGARWGDVLGADLGLGVEVVTEGLPGRTTVHDDPVEGAYRNGLRPLRAILESHKPLDLLIICLGTNDAKNRFGLNATDIALGVARLVREAKALDVTDKILVICPPAIQERGDLAAIFEGAEARSKALPEAMERFAGENGASYFDAGQVISVDPIDGVHWNATSHTKLGHAIAPVIRALLG